jgi:3-dehydroquinate dehydratase
MRPCVSRPLRIRSVEFGGAKPLFCVPLVAADLNVLLRQAGVARELAPDLVEWRADASATLCFDAQSEITGARAITERMLAYA